MSCFKYFFLFPVIKNRPQWTIWRSMWGKCTCWMMVNLAFFVLTDSGLFPVVFNLATRAIITSNATCGEDGPEQFCRLVEHVRRQPKDRIQCGVCHSNSLDPEESHPITNAIDGTNLWWQSPSIANGFKYHYVTITLDLQQVRPRKKKCFSSFFFF